MRISKFFAVVLICGFGAGCGATLPVPKRVNHSERSVLPGTPPVQIYSTIARQVRACWFAPADPVLTQHVFRAEVPARGQPEGQTRIVIYERAPDGPLGLKAYSIRFEPRGKGAVVTTENHRLPYPIAQKMSADVGYWGRGASDCNDPDLPAARGPRANR